MRRKLTRGGSTIELVFALMVLIPLLLGLAGIGLSMLKQMQTVQTARDAGSMFARNKIDFTQPGSQQILSAIAGSLGLAPGTVASVSGRPGSGSAVVILSGIEYVTASICTANGYTTANCPNYQRWVFTKQIVIGNSTLLTPGSRLGTPTSTLGSDGSVAPADQAGTPGVRVTGYNPWTSSSILTADLPVIQSQIIYASEVAAVGFRLPPFAGGTTVYSLLFF